MSSFKNPLLTEDQKEMAQIPREQLPILLTTRQAAAVIGVKPHDIRAWVSVGALTPLAFPLTQADGYFWRADVLALGEEAKLKLLCVKARKAMKLVWEKSNDKNPSDSCRAPNRTPPPTLLHDLVRQAEDKVLETYLRAEQIFQRTFELPAIEWGQRGTCAGRASWRQNQISLNPVLLIENRDAFIREIVPHEVAHLINRALHGPAVKPHGREWQSVMVALGLSPTRCHKFDVSNARVRTERRHTYRCKCTSHSVSQRVINRILRGAIYRCCHCGSAIEPVDSQS